GPRGQLDGRDLTDDNSIDVIVDQDIANYLDANNIPTSPQDLYVVITPPGHPITQTPTWEGFHARHDRGTGKVDRDYGWIRTDAGPGGGLDVDGATFRMSHVLAAAVADPTAGYSLDNYYGHTTVTPNPSWPGYRPHDFEGADGQISDYEAE